MLRSCFLLATLAVGLAACDFAALDDAVDDIHLIIGIEAQATTVGGIVVDAATGALLTVPVTLAYEPSVPGAVVDGFGDPVKGASIQKGVFNFGIANATPPTAARPIDVAVTLTAEGYLPQRRTIALADTGAYEMAVAMLAPARPPEGAAVQTRATTASASAGTAAAVTVSATPTTGAGAASVTVPQGARFKDASGQPLTAVAVRVTAVDPGSPALAAVPQGGASAVALGVAAVSVTDGTRRAASVSGPAIEVRLAVPAGATNPATGRPYATGDALRSQGFDAQAGRWVDAGTGVIAQSAPAGGRSSGPEAILTYGDGPTYEFLRATPAAQASGTQDLVVSINRNGTTGPVVISVTAYGVDAQQTAADGASSVTFRGLPTGLADRRVFATVGGAAVSAASEATCGPCAIALPPPPTPVSIVVRPTCAASGQQVFFNNLPPFTLYAREQGTSQWFSLGDVDGLTRRANGSVETVYKSTTRIRPGATYDVQGRYLEEDYAATYAVPASNTIDESFEVPSSFCQ